MSSEPNTSGRPEADLQAWVSAWAPLRQKIEARLAEHAARDPSLHFELNLAELELREIDEAIRRVGALARIIYGDDLDDAERFATGM